MISRDTSGIIGKQPHIYDWPRLVKPGGERAVTRRRPSSGAAIQQQGAHPHEGRIPAPRDHRCRRP